ncbi:MULTISPECIES: hypothetical protein [unclassified Streptomyces]|uniref:hypothetical protein n=1 Tax=unclassified Streptomyces TaxID=2593676 RepID=UPI002E81A68F|nr:hypothetical protein [Streptomyces sp. NBC_00589]WTI35469.1 hypothetical protein OIC96_10935 [Streptomyces sp. NBC_00775]WUB30858.1 hypothetical protein OHA51_38795 [Streptomyces sp. NBC_00589]
MAANRRRGRRTATIATTVAAVALTAGLVTGCDDVDNSLGCLRNADTIADSLKAIHEAGVDAAKDPTRTDESIDSIDEHLNEIDAKIGDKSDNDKVDKAVDDLDKAIADYNKAILNGDTNPDSSKIDDAADALKSVCTS